MQSRLMVLSRFQDAILIGHQELGHHTAVRDDARHPVHGRRAAADARRGVRQQLLRDLLEVYQQLIDQRRAEERRRGWCMEGISLEWVN